MGIARMKNEPDNVWRATELTVVDLRSAPHSVSAVPPGLPLSRGGAAVRMQLQLLDAPIEDLSHVQLVLRRARDLVDPAELLRLLSRLAEDTEDLPVERHLIYTS